MFDGIKYRSEVNVQICSILMLVPQMNSLVRPLKESINEFRKAKTPEMEAAVRLSLILIEGLMEHVSPEVRRLTLKYLDEMKDDEFRWFARYHQALKANQEPDRPKDMPNLTAVLGFAFWYLIRAVQENKLSEKCFRTFALDVVGMLQGKSQNERLADRLREGMVSYN